jgi:adenosyl cobinamide kinase/adenosyl cobinamide phosphate guanylyltransferase
MEDDYSLYMTESKNYNADEEDWIDQHQDELLQEWRDKQNSTAMERYFDFG